MTLAKYHTHDDGNTGGTWTQNRLPSTDSILLCSLFISTHVTEAASVLIMVLLLSLQGTV